MSNQNKDRGVFLYDEPTVEKLKSCALFWKNVVVFESYFTEVDQKPELVEPTLELLKADVLKICIINNLQSSLQDKIYCGLDKELWEYLYKHADRIAVNPKLPDNAEEIIIIWIALVSMIIRSSLSSMVMFFTSNQARRKSCP